MQCRQTSRRIQKVDAMFTRATDTPAASTMEEASLLMAINSASRTRGGRHCFDQNPRLEITDLLYID